jgi:alginate O-acetyltransferase complex protein AlgI
VKNHIQYMLFNSFHFFVFFIFVTGGYFALTHQFRWLWLLIASCYFYMVFMPIYILILGFTIVIDYYAGILIEKTEGIRRRNFLIISLITNIGVLAIFKYYNFFNDNITLLLHLCGYNHNPIPYLAILLPIGLSFHTFQAMSYTIEVYRGNQKAEKHFGIYALYVMFYPQLVAGPIERPQNILHQFYEKHDFDYKKVTNGLKFMLWGLFKKVVIADRLAILVNNVYEEPTMYTGLPLLIATFFFTFQIYCDFSGYSDIAIGAAQVMGFNLMKNFDSPYFSKTISEFWNRWHMSLSTWFRDYLYIPMGGNRVKILRWYFNLLFVFIISGFWHGANWTFIVWGALHGFYLVMAIIIQRYLTFFVINKPTFIFKLWQILSTFILVCIAWVFFRAKNITDALYIVEHFFDIPSETFTLKGIKFIFGSLGMKGKDFIISIVSIVLLLCIDYQQRNNSLTEKISQQPIIIRWFIYYCITIAIIIWGIFDKSQFIYFQF